MFREKNGIKRRKLNVNKHKAIRITDRIFHFVLEVNTRNACKMKFTDHLWLPFLDKPQSDDILFAMIYLSANKNIVTERKHVISKNGIIKSNETLENLSTAIV